MSNPVVLITGGLSGIGRAAAMKASPRHALLAATAGQL
jgi:NAD(P)-dependent dehydrogenase (short-subunit alcohol dehydrogenase family)